MPKPRKIIFTPSEIRRLRDAKKRKIEKLDRAAKDYLNRLIDLELRIEEEKDPMLREQYETLKKKLDEVEEEIVKTEKGTMSLSDPVLQDILSKKIRSEFVEDKATGEAQLKDEIVMYESLIADLKEQRDLEESEYEKSRLQELIDEYTDKVNRIKRAIAREHERKQELRNK